jgi:hypothetical protein
MIETECGSLDVLAATLHAFVEADSAPDSADNQAFCAYSGAALRALAERMRQRVIKTGTDEGADYATIVALAGAVCGLQAALGDLDDNGGGLPFTNAMAAVLDAIGEQLEQVCEQTATADEPDPPVKSLQGTVIR